MKLSRSKFFLFCCISFVVGIGVASFMSYQFLRFELFYFFLIISFLVLSFIFWNNNRLRLIFLIGLFLFSGIWRFSFDLSVHSEDKIWFFNNQSLNISGVISSEIDRQAKNQKFVLKSEKIINLNKSVSGKIMIFADSYPEYHYGDRLNIKCVLEKPEKIEDFSYDRYLARFNIYSVCYYPEIEIVSRGNANIFYTKLLEIKNKTREKINRGSREPYTSLIQAIILGDKGGLSDDYRLLFSRAGISHVIAISGMHIGILVIILMWTLIYLGLTRKSAFYVISLFLIIYVLIIGVPASAVRASLMGFLILWAMYLGRLNRLINSLVLVAVILLFFNPKLLRDDIGFQLSFLALLGIILLFPKLRDWAIKKDIPKLWGARDVFLVSIAAQLFTTPIIILNFSQISLVAPIVNLLVLWTLPFLLILSLFAIIISFIFPILSPIIFFSAEIVLIYIIKICEIFVCLPFAFIEF